MHACTWLIAMCMREPCTCTWIPSTAAPCGSMRRMHRPHAADAPAAVHGGWRDTGVRLAAASPVVHGPNAANAQLLQAVLAARGGEEGAPTADSTAPPAVVSADTVARLEELYSRQAQAQAQGSVDARLQAFAGPLRTRVRACLLFFSVCVLGSVCLWGAVLPVVDKVPGCCAAARVWVCFGLR
jgi:hypothetical protein